MNMRFENWNIQTVRWSGSLKGVERKLAKYRLDLMVVQEVRWGKREAEWRRNVWCFVEGKWKSSVQNMILAHTGG